MIKTYSELCLLPTFEERYNYLKLDKIIEPELISYDRYLNQQLYHSQDWRSIRHQVIVLDNGCDLGIPNRQLFSRIIIHHITPITKEDIEVYASSIFDLDNLVCTSLDTHNAIHYGNDKLLMSMPVVRTMNDTCMWR